VLLSAGLTLAVIAGLSSVASAATKKYSAEVRRTSYGIPHIKANDYGGLGYGSGYAFAQDNICTLADEIVTVRGERSRYFGPDARTVASAKVSDRNLDSDFLFQSYHDRKVVETLLKKKPPMGPSPEIRAMVKGYAAGYDRYLKDTGVTKIPDKRCRGKAWVKPISALDLWYRYYQLALIASALNFTDGLVAAEPPAGSAKAAGALPTSDEAIAWWKAHLPDRERIGSNAIGLGSQGTQSHNGMLLANPHFPWIGGERFYQFQLTLPGKLDVQGASLYGVPVVNIGFNRHVAWSHTVSTAWRFTPFRLQLAPNDPTAYVVDGKTE
jgi:acyl-homoserine-lactone acylase